ncbi:MAG: glutathione synthase [Pseudohongiellaceae bacterium]|jgi:glutathione synthase
MDPIETLHYKKDSTLAMLWAASIKGWELHYMQQHDIYLNKGEARANSTVFQVFKDSHRYYELGDSGDIALGELDVILMRKDPPFDNEFLYSTYILEAAEQQGAMVVNKPQSLRDYNEKLFATQFPDLCPPLIVSRNPAQLKAFHSEHQDVIYKPLDGMGGSSIFRVKKGDANLGVIIETLTNHGQQTIMAQRFIPEITEGDKRVLLINGEPVPYCLARIPSAGENRGNLAAGGTGRAQPLSDRDRYIAAQVGPIARERGLLLVGLDIIGDYLTEINVTSPTCMREIDDQYQTDIGGMLISEIEKLLSQK